MRPAGRKEAASFEQRRQMRLNLSLAFDEPDALAARTIPALPTATGRQPLEHHRTTADVTVETTAAGKS